MADNIVGIKPHGGSKKPWIVYRLRRDRGIPFRIFRVFYERSRAWDLMKSDYFKDTMDEHFRFWLLKHLIERRNLIYYKSKSAQKRMYMEFYRLVHKGLTIPPSMIYYFSTGKSLHLSDPVTIIDAIHSFLVQDFLECHDDALRKKLSDSINNVKKQMEVS